MSAIILFRYNREFPVCLQTLRILRRHNPEIPIHGLFGGNDDDIPPADLTGLLASNWTIPGDDFYHKWKDGDLCVRDWFRDHGRHIGFDHLYLLEWDMLFLQPLETIYGALVPTTNYCTFFPNHRYPDVMDWFFLDYHKYEVLWLLQHLERSGLGVELKKLSFGKMGGAVLCRAFLERFAASPVPSYSNDEVRLSVYSAAFGIPLRDNGMARDIRNIFFVDGEGEPDASEVAAVAARGGTIIHPVRILIGDILADMVMSIDGATDGA